MSSRKIHVHLIVGMRSRPPTRRRHRLDDQEVGKLPTPSDDVIVAPSISQSTIPPPLLRHRMSLLPSALKS
jgi:hypothetical protein